MAIKWNGWTARLPVKILCFVLIPVLAFASATGIAGLLRLNQSESVDTDLLFATIRNNDYFFDFYAPTSARQAELVFWYQSEEYIRSMGCLEWRPVDAPDGGSHNGIIYEGAYEYESGAPVDSGESPEPGQWVELRSTNPGDRETWGTAAVSDLENPEVKEMVASAINHQISEYYGAKKWLESQTGLYYFVTDAKREFTNLLPSQRIDFIRQQPVYLIEENGRTLERSRSGDRPDQYGYGYGDTTEPDQLATVYTAYSAETVNARNSAWIALQQQLNRQFAYIVAPLFVAFALWIILMLGAGRSYGDTGIHFTLFDKPWLDCGFIALFLMTGAALALIFSGMEVAWRYSNWQWVLAFCAILSVWLTLPLAWLMSFAKRIKAGKWWRYTLIYTLLRLTGNRLRRFVKSLWAGAPLTARGALIGGALLVCMIFCAILGAGTDFSAALIFCLLFTAVAVYGILRYARKLHLLEQGAKAASGGSYHMPIGVTGGELGSIAASINNISAGMNAAVAERLKSERLKTELITNVSHDIRTPLTSLITYTDLLKNEGLDSEKAPEYLEILIQKSARLKTLTDDLFEATKAASGNIKAEIDALDLADFVRQVLGEMDERLQASGLDFRLNLPERAPVYADGKLLWRVMENLLSNAFRYALKGSRVYLDIAPENSDFRLEIKNISEYPLNIAPDELIERFKRGDDARSGDGSGLGLSIAQSFVHAQGGRFTLSIDGDLFKAAVYLPKQGAPNSETQ